ncbi:hypothetical protein SKAU_G00233150 [Synaphobranchus kaupii]|uniref:Uncharacterized protein n=1 Tax=Synaphobranchus kaupii TaxID=118154 RepID=A0A9Q1F6G9_SYNKA|nr:hypothetical protein SKAU_G00233150 [Synaphobranchus kaupii]
MCSSTNSSIVIRGARSGSTDWGLMGEAARWVPWWGAYMSKSFKSLLPCETDYRGQDRHGNAALGVGLPH